MSENRINAEIASIERKSDQSCSVHARMRDQYAWRANMLDSVLMAAATYLVGLALVEPALGVTLSFGFERTKLNAILTLITLFLTIVQFKNEWKARAQAHQKSAEGYANIKTECRALRAEGNPVTALDYQRIRHQYEAVTAIGTEIPDNKFLGGKAYHLRKVFVSRYLDEHPGAWVPLVKIKLFLRDNLGLKLLGTNAGSQTEQY